MSGSASQAGLILPFCLLLSGCGGVSEPLEQTVEQTHRIAPNARVEISNQDGSIEVYGSNRPELYVEATKKAYTNRRLARLGVNIAAQPDSVSITTTFPSDKGWSLSDRSGTVDYVVVVPATAIISRLELKNGEIYVSGMTGPDIHATVGSGRLFGRNCFSNMHFQVGTGVLGLTYDWWERKKFSVAATIRNGKASVTMPGEASFRLVAESPNGRIANDFAEQRQRNESVSRKTNMTAGEAPPADIRLRAENGNIRIVEANP
jgi:DUF4097 and DUF4098 domain-containing protein YvlB